MTERVHVIDHPILAHKLALLRRKGTRPALFRALVEEMGMLLGYEATRDLPTETVEIESPLARLRAPRIEGQQVVLVPILRAGAALLEGVLRILPTARVGHLGLQRDHRTLEAVEYYTKIPNGLGDCVVLLLDPMLATAGSAIAALDRLRSERPRAIKFLCLIAAPEGLRALHARHPDVAVYTAAIDERLDERGYILPGLGDAGDRMYGTLE